MYVLGINAAYHESAACLLHDGELVASIEEERLSRRKHGKSAVPESGAELPRFAINHCLDMAGANIGDVVAVGYSLDPVKRLHNRKMRDRVYEQGWGSPEGEQRFYESIQSVPGQLQEMGFKGDFSFLPHHLCHAASAYYPSPFEESAILCVDGIAEIGSTLFAYGQEDRIETLGEILYPSSLGFLWEKISKYLGFSEYDACKVMGLASYGNPDTFLPSFEKLAVLTDEGRFAMDGDLLRFRVEDYSALEEVFGLKKRKKGAALEAEHHDMAAALQVLTNRVFSHMIDHLMMRTGSKNLCMAGGVALNCVANREAFEGSAVEELYIQPAAHDAGTAIGAALLASHMQEGMQGKRFLMQHPYTGPSFSNDEIEKALINKGLFYSREARIEETAARLVAAGKIVGWFQGAMEFGPRALGNRSLLADPRLPQMKQILNDRVKHREAFRPFAPSILAEEAQNWFLIGKITPVTDFMLLAYPVRPEVRHLIPAVVHVDGTSRVQTVRKETNPRYHGLISHFQALTGVPIVLNTSFNDNEPIVCTPDDAIGTFLNTRIDALAIGDFLVKAENLPKKRRNILEKQII